MVFGNPVNSRDDIGVGTGAIVPENLNSDNVSALGNTAVLISALHKKGRNDYTH